MHSGAQGRSLWMEKLQGQRQAERLDFPPARAVELSWSAQCCRQHRLRWEWRGLNKKIYGESGLL